MLLDVELESVSSVNTVRKCFSEEDDLITFDEIPIRRNSLDIFSKSSGRFIITTTPVQNNSSNTSIEVEIISSSENTYSGNSSVINSNTLTTHSGNISSGNGSAGNTSVQTNSVQTNPSNTTISYIYLETIQQMLTNNDVSVNGLQITISNINIYTNMFKQLQNQITPEMYRESLIDPFYKELFRRYYKNNMKSLLNKYTSGVFVNGTSVIQTPVPDIIIAKLLQIYSSETQNNSTLKFIINDTMIGSILSKNLL